MPGFEVYAAIFVASLIITSFVLQPRQQTQKPEIITDAKIPTAEEGKEIPVLFGTRDIESPNVVWYGDLRAAAIRKKGGKK